MRLRKRSSRVPKAIEAFGVPVCLDIDADGLDEQILEMLPPGWKPCQPTSAAARFRLGRVDTDLYEVRTEHEVFLGQARLDMALDVLDAQIRLYIATYARDWTFVHAGVVAKAGKALLIPGESFSGKSTLVGALVEAGAVYYSDEYAVLDEDGFVHPYPRRISLRLAHLTQDKHVNELGGAAGESRAEVAVVVLTRFELGHEWQPRRLSAGQGVPTVLANTIPAQERPAQSLRAVSRALSGALVLEGERGEAELVAVALLEELDARGADGAGARRSAGELG